MTPRQLRLLRKRHQEQTEHWELLMGVLAAAVANFSMAAPAKPLVPAVFMPSRWGKPVQSGPAKRESRRAIAQRIRSFMLARVTAE